MSTTYTINCGRANDCHAGRCRNLYVSRCDWSVLVAGRSMEYEGTMKFLFALWLTAAVALMVYAMRTP